MGKKVSDLDVKHFSRYGEFLVSFELSKYGWNVYSPMYDQYIDLIAYKFTCKKCGELWVFNEKVICSNSECGKLFTTPKMKEIKSIHICENCGFIKEKYRGKCEKCKIKLTPKPQCDECFRSEINSEVIRIPQKCSCGHEEYRSKTITIQVKSSRLEKNKKRSYATDMKTKDLLTTDNHYFIWCLIDDEHDDKSTFIVLSVQDFKNTMGDSLYGNSFFKNDDRQHFNADTLENWAEFKDDFSKLG